MCHRCPRPASPPSPPEPHSTRSSDVLIWSTRSLSCTLALVDVLDVCQPPRLVTRPLGPSFQVSRSLFTALGPSAWYSLLDLLLAVDHRLWAPHQHTTSQETCRTHSFRHGNVSYQLNLFVDHVDNHSHKMHHKGTSRPYVSKKLCKHNQILIILKELLWRNQATTKEAIFYTNFWIKRVIKFNDKKNHTSCNLGWIGDIILLLLYTPQGSVMLAHARIPLLVGWSW